MQINDIGNNGTHLWFKVITDDSLISQTETLTFLALDSYNISGTQHFGSKNKILTVSIKLFGWQDDSVISVVADHTNLTIGTSQQVTIDMSSNFIGGDAE